MLNVFHLILLKKGIKMFSFLLIDTLIHEFFYITVTLLARLRGLSGSYPLFTAV